MNLARLLAAPAIWASSNIPDSPLPNARIDSRLVSPARPVLNRVADNRVKAVSSSDASWMLSLIPSDNSLISPVSETAPAIGPSMDLAISSMLPLN